jgi:hypothetical protein
MLRLPTALLATALLIVPALGQANTSAYTDLNLDQCSVLESDDFGTSWACPGYKGYPLYVAEGDLRFLLSYGFGALDEPAAGQTLPPFNTLGPRLEWRLRMEAGVLKPFATIVRYHTADPETGEDRGQVLVVTQLEPGSTCQIAWIDALANANANELAREAADENAGSFDCTTNPEVIGEFSAWE